MRVESQNAATNALTVPATPSVSLQIDALIESAVDLAMDAVDTALNASGVVPTGSQPDLNQMAGLLASLDSPEALMALAETWMRNQRAKHAESDSHAEAAKAESASADRKHALDRAIKAAKKKSKRPRWLRKLIKAIVSAVAAAVSVFTAGAATGLMVAGLVLMFAGDKIAKGLNKLGIIPDKAVAWVSLALQIAGAALTMGAGANGAANATTAVVDALNKGQELVTALVAVAEAVADSHTAVWGYKELKANITADGHKLDVDAAYLAMEEAVDEFRASFDRFTRVSGRLAKMAEAQGEARMAATQLLG